MNAVNLAKQAGFENISVDLIYGLPTQTISGVKNDLEKFMKLDARGRERYLLETIEKYQRARNLIQKENKVCS